MPVDIGSSLFAHQRATTYLIGFTGYQVNPLQD